MRFIERKISSLPPYSEKMAVGLIGEFIARTETKGLKKNTSHPLRS